VPRCANLKGLEVEAGKAVDKLMSGVEILDDLKREKALNSADFVVKMGD